MPDRADLQSRVAAARARLGSLRPQIDETNANTPTPPAPVAAPSGWKRYGPMAIRGVSGLLSGIASDAPGIGTAIGAGVGAGGEYLAEKVGGEDVSPKRIAAEGALGAVPFAGLRKVFGGGRVVGDALAGAAMAGGGELVRGQANEGLHLPTSEEVSGAGKAAVVGGGIAGLLGGLFRGRAPKSEPLEVDRYMPNSGGNEPAYREGVTTNRQGFTPDTQPPISLNSESDRLRADLATAEGSPFDSAGGKSTPPPARLTPPTPAPKPTGGRSGLRSGPESAAQWRSAQRTATPYDPEREYGSFLKKTVKDEVDQAAAVRGTPADIPNNPQAQALEKLRVAADRGDVGDVGSEGGNWTWKDIQGAMSPGATRTEEVAPSAQVPVPSTSTFLSPKGYLPAFGETSEGMAAQRLGIGPKTRTLRPDQSTLDLANELAQSELGPGARVKSLKSYLRPTGDDELSKALRQRAHIADSAARRQGPNLGSESGSVDPEFLKDIAIHGGGGVIGAGVGAATDPEDPTRGAVLGGMVGMGAPAIARNPKAAEALRYFSMLSSPLTHAKNILGNVGSWGIESAVKGLSGDTEGAAKLFKAPFLNMGRTRDAARAAFAEGAPETANRTGMAATGRGLLSLPGRAIHAIDAASRDVLERGGLDPERAAKATFSNEPESVAAKGILSLQRKSGLVRAAVPFAKTPLNIVERGVEHSPLAPFLPSARAALTGGGAKSREAVARMFLGTVLGGGAYMAGADDPYSIAAAGPAALPVALGGFLASGKDTSAPDSITERAIRQTARMIPGMTPQIPGTQQFFASYVPNAARDVAEAIDPADDRETPGYFGETGKRIPIVRESLPEKRVGSSSTTAAHKRRARRPRAR